MVNYISLSVNENKDYYNMLPTVAFAYRKFFPESVLVLSALNSIDTYIIDKFRPYCDELRCYQPIPEVPTCNLAKIVRQYTAAYLEDSSTVMINDMDTIVLQRKFFEDRWNKRPKGSLLAIGKELYKGKKNSNNFPISYMAGESEVFQNLFRCKGLSWTEFIKSVVKNRTSDIKTDIQKPFKVFSDESYINAIRSNTKIFHQPRIFVPAVDSVARRTKLDLKKLAAGRYFEAHHLIPINENISKMKAICNFLGTELRVIS
jgi:hypothetical protein